jgi:hypothetical protein
MPDRTELIRTYEPIDLFEAPHRYSAPAFDLPADAGSVTVTLRAPRVHDITQAEGLELNVMEHVEGKTCSFDGLLGAKRPAPSPPRSPAGAGAPQRKFSSSIRSEPLASSCVNRSERPSGERARAGVPEVGDLASGAIRAVFRVVKL